MKGTLSSYGQEFELKLISIILDNTPFLTQISDILKPSYFFSNASQWVIENRVKQGKPFSALAEAVMPPISLFDGLAEELQSIYEGEKFDPQTSQILQRLPPYGRLIQDTLLGAREVKRLKDALED